MSIIDIKQITRQFFDDAYNQGNLEGIDNLVTPSFVYHARGEDVQGIENFKKWIASDRVAFPDMRFTIVDSIAESNKIASTFVVEGTHKQEFRGIPATHKKFETVGITVFHFDGNEIKEAWVVVDGLSAALQIGVVRRV